jgi:hypothetical protein
LRKEQKPVGKLRASFKELFEAGCIQTGGDSHGSLEVATGTFSLRFIALMLLTENNPCDGCPVFQGGSCRAYKRYHTGPTNQRIQNQARIKAATTAPGGKSVRQLAKELNISINEVRRRKHRGEL